MRRRCLCDPKACASNMFSRTKLALPVDVRLLPCYVYSSRIPVERYLLAIFFENLRKIYHNPAITDGKPSSQQDEEAISSQYIPDFDTRCQVFFLFFNLIWCIGLLWSRRKWRRLLTGLSWCHKRRSCWFELNWKFWEFHCFLYIDFYFSCRLYI